MLGPLRTSCEIRSTRNLCAPSRYLPSPLPPSPSPPSVLPPCWRNQPQRFELPKPIVTLGGKAKLLLLGMAQRQTLEKEEVGETANHYYVCLSYVALRGAQVPGVSLALGGGSDPAKPLRISCNTQARSNPTRSRKEQGKVKPLWINDESSFWLRRILQRISSLLSGLKCITLLCLRIHHNRLLRRF